MPLYYQLPDLNEQGPYMPCLGVNIAAVCPTCGEVWFRVSSGRPGDWRGFTWPCEKCPPWPFDDSIPGSVLSLLASQALDFLPPAVLAREFNIHMKLYEIGV